MIHTYSSMKATASSIPKRSPGGEKSPPGFGRIYKRRAYTLTNPEGRPAPLWAPFGAEGVLPLNLEMENRAQALADYILETGCTVRAAAERFGVSKSTVHKDIAQRLRALDRLRWQKVRAVLEKNKAERHLRGGEATRKKYAK